MPRDGSIKIDVFTAEILTSSHGELREELETALTAAMKKGVSYNAAGGALLSKTAQAVINRHVTTITLVEEAK